MKDASGKPVEYATIFIKEIRQGTQSDHEGNFLFRVVHGSYTLHVQLLGYDDCELTVTLNSGEKKLVPVELTEKRYALREVVIEAKSPLQTVSESPFNAVALDAKVQHNSNTNLSDMLNKVSGVRIRETGGVGSEMQVMMDGFSGKHVKVFIDGVPQEGVGHSFGLNNIPVNYAERIEIYKGVVPVEFATDAIGGIINIVTKKGFSKRWRLDASYSYGSFNTHKSYFNFGQTFTNGLTYEVNAFQNYSDNNYSVETSVKEFLPDGGSSTNSTKKEQVKRFHDTYHNEVISVKAGLLNKSWADRLIFGAIYSRLYQELQTGVRQEIVFGGKYRKGYSIMPSFEYRKGSLFVDGLDVTLTGNYNKNIINNVDTSSYEFNWRGEKRPRVGISGEQSYMHLRSVNNNWNATVTLRYQVKDIHSFTFNHVMSLFHRSNRSLLTPGSDADPIPKETQKQVGGLSYQLKPNKRWNMSLFGKYYYQHAAGPLATSTTMDEIIRITKEISAGGYGAAATYFILPNLQGKLSYEKVYRLPTVHEMFGNEDLETGKITINPENSHNLNLNIHYNETFDRHAIYLEGGLVYRNITDYIRRNITGLGGGRYGATYINHGKVLTRGFTLTARYNYSNLLSVGGNFTEMNTRDNEKKGITGAPSNTFKARMPNIPYRFANSDIAFFLHNFGAKGNILTLSYDNSYVKSFPLYSEALGNSESQSVIPTRFSHNLSVAFSIKEGRYNFTIECQNFTNEQLYDNFSLQKAGRAFYGKVRVSL